MFNEFRKFWVLNNSLLAKKKKIKTLMLNNLYVLVYSR